jgi:hypothetical protein
MEVVVLRDGSRYQGELVEKVPGDHVTIKLATGEIKRFDFADLAPSPSPSALPAPLSGALGIIGADTSSPPPEGQVDVRIETSGSDYAYPSLMEAAPGGPDVGWRQICMAPCTARVDAGGLFKIGGRRMADSNTFRLGSAPSQTLYVKPSNNIGLALGISFLAPGIPLSIVGATFLATGSHESPLDTLGLTFSIIGGAFVVGGVIALLLNPSTTVSTDQGARVARAPQGLGFEF